MLAAIQRIRMKRIILGIIGLSIATICYIVFMAPGQKHDYYCGKCGESKSEYMAFDTIVIWKTYHHNSKISNWHIGENAHVYMMGGSSPYNTQKGDYVDGQYMYWYLHELIEQIAPDERPALIQRAIGIMNKDDGHNSCHNEVLGLVSEIKMRLTNR